MTNKSKVLNYLSRSDKVNTLTASQMRQMFGIKNPSAVINELRNDGYAIYRETKKTSAGKSISFYRLGAPSREIVAAGIMALRQQGLSVFA